jgi:hypothetical protein
MLAANGNAPRLAVGLYRVSTAEQGQSGLGLEAQQASVRGFCADQGWSLVAEYSDIASGKDDRRPGFHAGPSGPPRRARSPGRARRRRRPAATASGEQHDAGIGEQLPDDPSGLAPREVPSKPTTPICSVVSSDTSGRAAAGAPR